MEVGRKKQRATVLAIWYLGKDFCSKNLRDTVLAIWDLGRG